MNLVNMLQCGRTALHFAAEKNSLAIVELLIRSGADLNAKDEVRNAFIEYPNSFDCDY